MCIREIKLGFKKVELDLEFKNRQNLCEQRSGHNLGKGNGL